MATRSILSLLLAPAIALVAIAAPAGAAAFDHSHARFDQLLRSHVVQGRVDYGGLSRERPALAAYAKDLAAAKVAEFSRSQALTFWINAYNAFTLQLILDQEPKSSIRQIDGAWDKFRFAVGGKQLSLNDIEHQMIRKKYNDPRIHAVLVCAARSCPILESRAFIPKTIDRRLDAASRRFASDGNRNTYEGGALRVSKIFEWYGDDFIARFAKAGGGKDKNAAIRGFIAAYSNLRIPASATIGYLDYDWSLNGKW